MAQRRTQSTSKTRRAPHKSGAQSAARGRPEDVRGALISEGLALLSGEAPAAVSLRRVAARAGVSHAATYRHFADRDALFAAIAAEGFHMFASAQNEALARAGDDFERRFLELGYAYVRFTLDFPGYARIMFGGAGFDFRAYRQLVRAAARTFRQLRSVVRLGEERGFLPADDTRGRALAAWAMVHGVAMLYLDGQLERPDSTEHAEAHIKNVISYLKFGLAAPGDA